MQDSYGNIPLSRLENNGNVNLVLPQIKEVISKSLTPAKMIPKAK